MSTNKESLLDKENNNIEPFDKIEQGKKKYIPNIPSVILDMKKNNININNNESDTIINDNKENTKNKNDEIKIYDTKESNINSNVLDNNDENGIGNKIMNYWNTFTNNQTVLTIINPFQDDSEFVQKVYKVYSCVTISLILIVILLSITLS